MKPVSQLFEIATTLKGMFHVVEISPMNIAIQIYIEWLTGSMIRFLLSVHSVKFRFVSGSIWFLSINQVPIEICSENNRFSCSAKICIRHIKRINFELIKNKSLNHHCPIFSRPRNYRLYSPGFLISMFRFNQLKL